MSQKYFKESDYSQRWSKAVDNKDSLRMVLKESIRAISPSKGDCLLDVGVGTGRFIEPCLNAGVRSYIGVDLSKDLLKEAKDKLKNNMQLYPNLHLIEADAEHLPFKRKVFDKVICIGVFFFLPHMESFVNEISILLKKDGLFLVDFMDTVSLKLSLLSQGTKIFNEFTSLLRKVHLTRILLKLLSWIDSVPLFHLYEGWFTSYLTYGMTPLYVRGHTNVLNEFQANKLKVDQTFINKSVFILAHKT